jgi:hypothetical protein
MASYLGAIGTHGANLPFHWYFLAWSHSTIAEVIIGPTVATYASHGGYIYVT